MSYSKVPNIENKIDLPRTVVNRATRSHRLYARYIVIVLFINNLPTLIAVVLITHTFNQFRPHVKINI